jgi:hypothetical protein
VWPSNSRVSLPCAGAAGAQLLGQRALRRELQFKLAGKKLALELLVLPHVAGDHLLDLARLEQLPEAKAVHTRVVRNHGEVLHPRVAQSGDQRLGNAAQAEAADRHQLAVSNNALERRCGAGIAFLHYESPIVGITAKLIAPNCPRCIESIAASARPA